jgi:hypothetical protein
MIDSRVQLDELPMHPRTGLSAVGYRKNGQPIWPIRGASDDPDPDDGGDRDDDPDDDPEGDDPDDDGDRDEDDRQSKRRGKRDRDFDPGSEDDPAFGDDWKPPSKPDHRKMVRTIAAQKDTERRLKGRNRTLRDQLNDALDELDESGPARRGRGRGRDDRDDDDRGRRGRGRGRDRDDADRGGRDDADARVELAEAKAELRDELREAGFRGSRRELNSLVNELRQRDYKTSRRGGFDFSEFIDDLRDDEPDLFGDEDEDDDRDSRRSTRRGGRDSGRSTRRGRRTSRRRDEDSDEGRGKNSTDLLLDQLNGIRR